MNQDELLRAAAQAHHDWAIKNSDRVPVDRAMSDPHDGVRSDLEEHHLDVCSPPEIDDELNQLLVELLAQADETAKADWDESLHPRGTAGKWVGKLTREAPGKPKLGAGYIPARGDHLDVWKSTPVAKLNEIAQRPKQWWADTVITEIADRQFPGGPEAGTKADLDRAVDDGWREVFRGVKYGDDHQGGDLHATLRAKDGFVFGTGIYGNGIYASTSEDVARYYAGWVSRSQTPGQNGTHVRMAINPAAKVVDHGALMREIRADVVAGPFNAALQDPGRYAAAKGYDVIHVTGRQTDGAYDPDTYMEYRADQYVILNRSVLMIEDGERT